MLYQRVISGLLFLPIFYLVVWKLPPAYFTGLVALAAIIGQYEFYRMARKRELKPLAALGLLLGVLVVVQGFYHPGAPDRGQAFFYITVCVLVIMLARLFSPHPVEGALEDIAVTFLGIFYVAMLFGFQAAIRTAPDGRQWTVFMYFVIWATDIGAYSLGVPFGRHKLYPKISPKKSVEGLIGGVCAAAGMALLCRVWFMPPLEIWEAALIGIALAAVGTLGDFVESLLKRSVGVKDSGGIIPGHGGMLDRMDSMLFAAPVLYYYLGMR